MDVVAKPIDPTPARLAPFNLQGEANQALYFKRVERVRESMISRQQRRILIALNRQMRNALRGGIDGLVDRIEAEPIQRAYEVLYVDVGVDFAERIFDETESVKHYKAAQSLIDDWIEIIMQLVRAGEVARLIQRVTDETKSIVRAIIARGIEEGLSPEKLARQIQQQWEGVSRTRARRIARTETIRASNFGSIEGARSTGLELKKEWIPTFDSRTRDEHRMMQRHEHVTLDVGFVIPNIELGGTIDETGVTVGPGWPAAYPADPNLPPGQSINCRCAVAFVTQDLPTEPKPTAPPTINEPDSINIEPGVPQEFVDTVRADFEALKDSGVDFRGVDIKINAGKTPLDRLTNGRFEILPEGRSRVHINYRAEDFATGGQFDRGKYDAYFSQSVERGFKVQDSTLRHEMGHVAHWRQIHGDFGQDAGKEFMLGLKRSEITGNERLEIIRFISNYAASDPTELVAEVYAARLSGKEIPPSILDLYRRFNGPPLP